MVSGLQDNLEHEVEFHFTEGFSGEKADITPSKHDPVQLKLVTRLQTGLAHIEIFRLFDKEEVEIRIDEIGIEHIIIVDSQKIFVTIQLRDQAIIIDYPTNRPGYV